VLSGYAANSIGERGDELGWMSAHARELIASRRSWRHSMNAPIENAAQKPTDDRKDASRPPSQTSV
jgi:hypothetical protein